MGTGKDIEKICLWCGESTKGEDSVEHIFPKSIGGIRTLPLGSVHKKCTDELDLDRFFKKGHIAMMDAFQIDPQIKGYRRKGKVARRKQEEKTEITGIGDAQFTKLVRNSNVANQINPIYAVTSDKFVRALHKCLANILCYSYGSKTARETFKELINFVNGTCADVHPWSYGISFPNRTRETLLIAEPKILAHIINEKETIVSFIHTSGIWIMGSHPFSINPFVIENMSELILKAMKNKKDAILDSFGFQYENRSYFGRLKFLWTVKQIEGKPTDESLYLLTNCKVCGQKNPTGLMLQRSIIYEGNLNTVTSYSKNTWNRYTLDDLKRLGLKVEKWEKESLEAFMNQGISIPLENDVRKLKISECKTSCLNCGSQITYNAEDCFV